LLWVSKSCEKLCAALRSLGHTVSASSVKRLLPKLGFSRQSNRKADEGSHHPDRNAQFEHINAKVLAAQAAGQPVISVDTKKKELLGNFKNAGSDWRPKGSPQRVNVHDFADKELGKAVPYGIYDVSANEGWVSVGITNVAVRFDQVDEARHGPGGRARPRHHAARAVLPRTRHPGREPAADRRATHDLAPHTLRRDGRRRSRASHAPVSRGGNHGPICTVAGEALSCKNGEPMQNPNRMLAVWLVADGQ
jgi:hypothetical protein